METKLNKLKTEHDVKNYLIMAQNGHMPLFFKEWIQKNQNSEHYISYNNASKTVKDVFTALSRHRTITKMQTAIISMDQDKRDIFMSSFMKMVEYNSLKETTLLQ